MSTEVQQTTPLRAALKFLEDELRNVRERYLPISSSENSIDLRSREEPLLRDITEIRELIGETHNSA